MFEFISERPTVEDWRHDLDLSMGNLGIFPMSNYKTELFEQLRMLKALLSRYEGVVPSIYHDNLEQPYWYKFEVRVNCAFLVFQAYVKYEVNEERQLTAVLNYTHLPRTNKFPIKGGAEWRSLILKEKEIQNPGFVVATIKNVFIRFESYRQIGRDIQYVVQEE